MNVANVVKITDFSIAGRITAHKTLLILDTQQVFSFLILKWLSLRLLSHLATFSRYEGNSLSVADRVPLALKTTKARCTVVDKVEARKNLNNAETIEVVLAHLLNNYGGNAESFLRATKNELQNTRKRIDGLKALLK